MASFSSSLEQALRRALQYANQRSHEYATLEHLLLSLLDDRDAAAVMRVFSSSRSTEQAFMTAEASRSSKRDSSRCSRVAYS